ncbi:MAG: 4Fe-4S dicluster domain-containing protein [Deltaproteobacteria bacterium]|nr:4Fe-4S dicluster domain-containing protein [Deltaproteobacteria bacterium]
MANKKSHSYPSITLADCIACLMCVDVCPTGALDIVTRNGARGFRRYPCLSFADKCVSCAACKFECPTGAIFMKQEVAEAAEEEM